MCAKFGGKWFTDYLLSKNACFFLNLDDNYNSLHCRAAVILKINHQKNDNLLSL